MKKKSAREKTDPYKKGSNDRYRTATDACDLRRAFTLIWDGTPLDNLLLMAILWAQPNKPGASYPQTRCQ